VVLSPSNTPTGVKAIDLGSDGAKGMSLTVPGLGSAKVIDHAALDRGEQFLHMDGPTVFKFATRMMPKSTLKVLENAGMSVDDIDLLIPHQANERIIDLAIRRLGIPREKVFVNVQKYGNTSAASIPLALIEALEEGRLKEGDHICMASFGAGLTWASAVVQWGQPLGETAEVVDTDLVWDIEALRKRLARTSTSVRVNTRRLLEETSYKASSLMVPLYTSVGRRLPWTKKHRK